MSIHFISFALHQLLTFFLVLSWVLLKKKMGWLLNKNIFNSHFMCTSYDVTHNAAQNKFDSGQILQNISWQKSTTLTACWSGIGSMFRVCWYCTLSAYQFRIWKTDLRELIDQPSTVICNNSFKYTFALCKNLTFVASIEKNEKELLNYEINQPTVHDAFFQILWEFAHHRLTVCQTVISLVMRNLKTPLFSTVACAYSCKHS